MGGNTSEADVFAIPDLWKRSRWLDQLSAGSPSLFNNTLDVSLKHEQSDILALAPINLDKAGFFRLPDVQGAAEPEEPESSPDSDIECSTSQQFLDSETNSDVWIDSNVPLPKPPSFRTWEAFNTGELQPHVPLFLSEAGTGAYDALLSWPTDSLSLANSTTPVVETRPYFASLLALSVGRESVFFSRSPEDGTFKRTLSELRVSGYSRQLLQGLERQAIWCGSTFLGLGAFSRSALGSSSSQCAVALASVISEILQAVESHMTVDGQFPKSLLQLQTTIKKASAILSPLRDLAARMPQKYTDEEILSLVFQEASTLEFSEKYIRDILNEMLRRVSGPWVETMEEWLGTRHEAGIPFTKANVGEVKGFVKVDVEVFTDDFGREVGEVDFRLSRDKVPDFLPVDIAESMFETGKNLRFIRTFHPGHPLSKPEIIGSSEPPTAGWLFDWPSILELESRVSQYQKTIFEAVRQDNLMPSCHNTIQAGLSSYRPMSDFKLNFFGIDESTMERRLQESICQLDQPFSWQVDEGSLGRIVQSTLSGRAKEGGGALDDSPHWSLLPILSFGGITTAQARIVNRESLRLLFEAHDIQAHLQLHRDFHLLGNGLFCSRLSHALFDPELESAERQAGVAMQGGVMGLRLGGRDTWPPASSELRLALMGVLSESYDPERGPKPSKPATIGRDASVLPGDLSFAVRDLSDEEIDKCMDPDALEALDFLRMSYTTPPELTSIITPIHLMHYDHIFKLLLRILRLLYIVNQLYRDTNSRAKTWVEDDASYRFVRESQHFISSLASYFLDSGVAIPWRTFEKKLAKVRLDLDSCDASADVAVHSPDQLREMHSVLLERIMFSLFLRKRQWPVLTLLEEIFAIILRYAKETRLQALGRTELSTAPFEPVRLYSELRKKLQLFITVCRGLSEKSRANGKNSTGDADAKDFGIGDDSLIAQLLMKLDMGDYYCRH